MKIKRAFLLSFFLTCLFAAPLTAQNETPPPKVQEESSKSPRAATPPIDPETFLKEEVVKEAENSTFYKELFNMLLTLGFLIALLYALAWFLRKMNATRVQFANETSQIKIFDQRLLSPRSTVYVVHYHGIEYFLGESQNGITVLNTTELIRNDEPPPGKKFMS